MTVSWRTGKTLQKINTEIIDFSCESARLKLKESTYPPKGKIVKLEIPPDPEKPTGMNSEMTWEMLAAKYLKEKLVEPTSGEFIVRRIGGDQSYIGIQAHKKGL